MGKQFWTGENLSNLLKLSVEDLAELYPDQTIKNLKRRKQEYSKKLGQVMERVHEENTPERSRELERLAEAFNDAGINLDAKDLSKATRAGFHVGYIRNADGEIEYTKPLPHVDFGKASTELDWQPAAPAKIYPSRRKPVDRDFKRILAFGDMQIDFRRINDELIPIHDEKAIEAMMLLAKDIRPDEMVNLGDTVDFASLSRFQKDSDHFYRTLQPSFQRIHDIYAQLRADHPNAKITEVDSNHHARLTKYVLNQMPDLYNFRRAGADDEYPMFTYPHMANLEHVGVDWISGYGGAEYEYKDDLAFIHGEFAVSNGSTAAKLSKANPDRNIVQGHKHSIESHYQTDRRGNMFGAFVVGALCRIDGAVPSYHSSIDDKGKPNHYQENWQQGVMVIDDYGNGHYDFHQVPIHNGKIFYQGKEYGTV